MPIHELLCRICNKPFLIDSEWVVNICPECDDKEFEKWYKQQKG